MKREVVTARCRGQHAIFASKMPTLERIGMGGALECEILGEACQARHGQGRALATVSSQWASISQKLGA